MVPPDHPVINIKCQRIQENLQSENRLNFKVQQSTNRFLKDSKKQIYIPKVVSICTTFIYKPENWTLIKRGASYIKAAETRFLRHTTQDTREYQIKVK